MRRRKTNIQRRTFVRRTKKRSTRGKVLPYIYNNKVYLEKKPQESSKAISKIQPRLIPIVGPVFSKLIGI